MLDNTSSIGHAVDDMAVTTLMREAERALTLIAIQGRVVDAARDFVASYERGETPGPDLYHRFRRASDSLTRTLNEDTR